MAWATAFSPCSMAKPNLLSTPPGDHTQPQPLLHQQAHQGAEEEGFTGIDYLGLGVAGGELLPELPAATAKGLLVKDIEGGAKLLGQGHRVAPADKKMIILDLGRHRKQAEDSFFHLGLCYQLSPPPSSKATGT